MFDRIKEGRTDLVFEYIAQGHDAHAKDSYGVSLMQWCAHYGDVSAIRYLLAHGVALDAMGPNLDLNGASFHGHWQLCQFVIEQGANVNHPLPDTAETPLHSCLCKTNRVVFNRVLRVLLENGADPNRATKPDVETDSFMRDIRTRGETPLHRAAAFGDVEAIQMLLDAGAIVDARDAHGDSPLTWASWHLRPRAILRMLCFDNHRVAPGGD